MRAVARYGQDPKLLRRVRVAGGWHGEGVAAAYPERTPPVPWPRAGRCWAGVDHPVVDVTVVIAWVDGGGAEAGLMRAAGSAPPDRLARGHDVTLLGRRPEPAWHGGGALSGPAIHDQALRRQPHRAPSCG